MDKGLNQGTGLWLHRRMPCLLGTVKYDAGGGRETRTMLEERLQETGAFREITGTGPGRQITGTGPGRQRPATGATRRLVTDAPRIVKLGTLVDSSSTVLFTDSWCQECADAVGDV